MLLSYLTGSIHRHHCQTCRQGSTWQKVLRQSLQSIAVHLFNGTDRDVAIDSKTHHHGLKNKILHPGKHHSEAEQSKVDPKNQVSSIPLLPLVTRFPVPTQPKLPSLPSPYPRPNFGLSTNVPTDLSRRNENRRPTRRRKSRGREKEK